MNAKLRSFSMKTMTALVVLNANPASASTLNLDTMPEDPLHRLSTYLPLNDLQSFEQVCKHTATGLRDAPLYQALTLDHPPKKATRFPVPGKDRILKLINGVNPDFILTLAGYTLDENFFGQEKYQLFDFPLKGTAYRPKNPPLRALRVNLDSLLHGFRRVEAPITAQARYYLAQMDYRGEGGPYNYIAARQGFTTVLNDPATPADIKAGARFRLAEMDYLGCGSPQDFTAARRGFMAVLTDPATPADFKAQARFRLAEMLYIGRGGAQDFTAARRGYTAVLHDPATPAYYKAVARIKLAEMNYFGDEGHQDLTDARQGYTAALHDPATPAGLKAQALFQVAHMDYFGDGGPQDFTAARRGFMAVLTDPATPADFKADARYMLAQMDYLGRGGPQDLNAAKEGFTAVLHDPATTLDIKAKARFYLAQMDHEDKRECDDSETKGDKRARDASDEENSEEPSGKKPRI